jgi:chromosome segregation protein
MRIKQIDLNGFKSFMERTVLELPQGVTAIVGPNGCGKSNVVDAIRWVLGEQSPKHLRGGAMEDVIFAGNAEHGPLGMAEVSLLLERDESDLAQAATSEGEEIAVASELPAELAKASEILVTRRYFRSGDSEYFINRAPCRLKDITELFLGTGVGTKAYAIVEQGRVDQLVNAKPEELRLFLEEAAGTTRFRSRKIAAERKMERTRDNLLRVQDVLRELERQMASLERQARRAEEYHRIKGDLRDLDLRVMTARQRTWSAEVERLAARQTALHADEAAVHDDIRRTQGATGEARAARTSHAERLRAVEEEITEQRLRAGDAQARATALAARAEELAGRATQTERDIGLLGGRLAELSSEADGLAAQAARLAADKPAAEVERTATEEHLAALASAGPPLESDVEQAKDALLEALGEEMRLRNRAEALRQRRDDLAGRRRKVDDEQRALGERLRANARGTEGARATVARLTEERVRVASEREALEAEQQALGARERAQAAVLDEARAETTRLRSRAESLRELQTRYEGCTRGVASLIAREPDGAALLASVLRVPAALERAVAAALGVRLTQVVVSDTAAAVGAVSWLRTTAAGSATVVPRDPERRAPVIVPPGRRLVDQIEVDPQHWALAEALLGHVLLADDLTDALALWRGASHPVTVVTPAGEAIDTLGAVSGGSEAPLEETLLARIRELRELEAALAASAKRTAAEEGALARLRESLAAGARATTALDERLQLIQVQVVTTDKDRERFEEDRLRIGADLEVGALEVGNLAGEDGEVAGELAALHARLAAAEQGVAGRRTQLVEQQAKLARWREDHAEAERVHTAAAVRAAALAERLRAVETDVTRAAARRTELEERLATARREADEATQGGDRARRDAAAAEVERGAAAERAAALDEERQRLLAAIAEADAALSADDAAERTARDRLEALREERAGLEVVLAERRAGLGHLAEQLAERYGLGLDALTDVTVEDDGQDEERAARVESLRARLLRLGDVNPGALAELEELRGRREFLVAQRTDLERSLDDLRRTIAKLTRTSRLRFEETFEAANEKLGEVFPKLFPNGKARLELTEPGEDGEPGVEIVVQPAGKKLQSLSLLSGGEKALTAVALILSLFLIRPTPFCLLDEVDAPLDEANIGRFNDLIRFMASASQFVLITHNRRTMEVAETLYGITMEQAGVSKVVSVRLREAA